MSDMYTSHGGTSRLQPGTRLNGIFEIEHPVASGGMGDIYRGHTVETGDPVAIKVMRSDLSDNTLALALFRKEASALHNIHHEAIVRYYVFSLDPQTQRHYLAMEFVDGEPLSDLLKSGPLATPAVRVLQQRLAAGLEAAHQHGIIHRDLSPDNILIPAGDFSRAKIIDFGIARSTKVGDGTIIGSGFAGKFNYVSPEQLGLYNGDVTAKSDIYSLGLVLAECLFGRAIDMGGSQFEVIEKRRTVPDLSGIDPAFRPLIEHMLQSDPQQRPQSMAEVAGWQATGAVPVTTRPQSFVTSQRIADTVPKKTASGRALVLTGIAAALLLSVGAGAYYFYLGQPASMSSGVGAGMPTLNPDVGADAQRAEDARRTAAEEAARKRAEETQRVNEANAAAASAAATAPTDRPPTDPKERIARFVNGYDGGDCFFIAPTSIAEGSATLEGYGVTAAPFEVLDYEFKRVNGFEATVGYYAVVQPQCPAVTFLSRNRNQRGAVPRLDISAGNLRSNGYVTGFVAGTSGRNVELLMIDHEGIVQSLTSLLKESGDTRNFTINLRRSDAGPPKLQLVFAIASTRPLQSLKPRQPGSIEIGSADRVFAALTEEAQQTGQSINVAAKSFNLEK